MEMKWDAVDDMNKRRTINKGKVYIRRNQDAGCVSLSAWSNDGLK